MANNGNPSVLKTIVFYGLLCVFAILIYQVIRGPVH